MDIQSWKNKGEFFSHGAHQIFYIKEGTGKAVLCIHGFPTSSWDWNLMWKKLTTNFQVIAPDMIGFGYSDKPKKYNYTIIDQADIHEKLLNKLQIKNVHILSHDYGDTVAQELLARHNEGKLSFTIESLCLLNGGLFPETHRPRLIQRLLLGPFGFLVKEFVTFTSFRRSFLRIFGENTKPTEQELRDFWTLIAYNHGQKVSHKIIRYIIERSKNRERWVGALQNTKVPLKLINGAVDPVSGIHMVRRYKKLIKQQDITVFDDIGHYPQTENAEVVYETFHLFVGAVKA